MNVKGAIMFHQYNNIINIKLTRPRSWRYEIETARKAIAKER